VESAPGAGASVESDRMTGASVSSNELIYGVLSAIMFLILIALVLTLVKWARSVSSRR